jgi:bacteriocin-like protein
MSKLKISDLSEYNENSKEFSDHLIEIQEHELAAIIGGLDPDDGGLAIIGLGIAAAAVGSVTAPAVATAAVVIGIGILLRDHL